MKPIHFPSAAAFRSWLKAHHDSVAELWVRYWKKATGKPSMTWSESVDEALCYGWIDGVRRGVDHRSYVIRFTPRRPGSGWSALNLRKMKALEAAGRMTEAGRRAFRASDHSKSGYSYQDLPRAFDAAARRQLKADPEGWAFFQRQPPGYRRMVTGWVMSAKKPETRARRLAVVVARSSAGQRLNGTAPGRGSSSTSARRSSRPR